MDFEVIGQPTGVEVIAKRAECQRAIQVAEAIWRNEMAQTQSSCQR
jgi:hypothetical protein